MKAISTVLLVLLVAGCSGMATRGGGNSPYGNPQDMTYRSGQ
ncbi:MULTISPECIES: hypothetical protein [Noviherbaspirillum]|jgi:hypothetical protein|uniref:Lipoprotein n=1 Tax=Noviherbaspirillum album TaxID=3080276 RepID=A0ABU6JH45_9BURK|nr:MULTISPECIES: hypothetical protein [Noviherbaspirillum]MEC4722863.1 hypothetical protein [Noviherbaspirillum sp. CPCC 100848]